MTPWAFVVLALGLFRIVRLIGWDDLPPIARLRARITRERVHTNSTDSRELIYTYGRPTLAHFLACAYCQGWWVCLVGYVAWRVEPGWTLAALAPFALSAAVGIVARRLDP